MKIVYNNPVLELTCEEETTLIRASEILESICDQVDDYINCEHKCPIYKHCPYHKDLTSTTDGKIHEILNDIASEAEREVR